MRREDVLADQDGSFTVPLQIERTFNGEREIISEDTLANFRIVNDDEDLPRHAMIEIRNSFYSKRRLI